MAMKQPGAVLQKNALKQLLGVSGFIHDVGLDGCVHLITGNLSLLHLNSRMGFPPGGTFSSSVILVADTSFSVLRVNL